MQSFEIDGITLIVPDDQLTDKLSQALRSGSYEAAERKALERHLRPGDRVLDLGAGAGYVSIVAARVVGPEAVVAVEASPLMQKALHRNLRRNQAGKVTVRSGAAVPDEHEGETAGFTVRRAFWASGLAEDGAAGGQAVPALRLSGLIAEHRPNVVVMDVEGAEARLCLGPWPEGVRTIVVELHPHLYPPETIRQIFDAFSRAGFAYMPWGSRGAVVVFQRPKVGAA